MVQHFGLRFIGILDKNCVKSQDTGTLSRQRPQTTSSKEILSYCTRNSPIKRIFHRFSNQFQSALFQLSSKNCVNRAVEQLLKSQSELSCHLSYMHKYSHTSQCGYRSKKRCSLEKGCAILVLDHDLTVFNGHFFNCKNVHLSCGTHQYWNVTVIYTCKRSVVVQTE